ncbi:MAG: hypothetical protein HQL11_00470, partial [Candidatus Omnitrophica bacterium]|nr:hypothetical protein [Candidatus Omnitrophota bacterium]
MAESKRRKRSAAAKETAPEEAQPEACETCEDDSCAHFNASRLWVMGILAVVVAAILAMAVFGQGPSVRPVADPMAPVAYGQGPVFSQPGASYAAPGMTPVAYVPPNCVTCPNVT